MPMPSLDSDQRYAVYLQEAERTGIHQPLLAALYQVHNQPKLPDGTTGLGITPAHRITLEQVSSFEGQVYYAANTLRSLIRYRASEGWQGRDLWEVEQGRYTDRFLHVVATGYAPPAEDVQAARLESSNKEALRSAYLLELEAEQTSDSTAVNLTSLDQWLLTLVNQLPAAYNGLSYERAALLEAFRLWNRLDSQQAAIAALRQQIPVNSTPTADSALLDAPLLHFVQHLAAHYDGYPEQREALIRLTQLWRQLESRQAAIVSLAKTTSPTPDLNLLDPALIALAQRLPSAYSGKGEQRHAVLEAFRLWHKLTLRSDALIALGIDASLFQMPNPPQEKLSAAATQADRALLNFIRQVPVSYLETTEQRETLLQLTQLWRNLETREQTVQSLLEDLKQMYWAKRDSPEAAPVPIPAALAQPPDRWTVDNLQLHASILTNGSFTWADATQGGIWMPANQPVVDAIVRMADLMQRVRDRLGRPLSILRWYCPADHRPPDCRDSKRRHSTGDAIDIYCNGLTGDQLYWFLDPWWPGGLGRYQSFPHLCHLDSRTYRIRWQY